jgi:hypothetical protein
VAGLVFVRQLESFTTLTEPGPESEALLTVKPAGGARCADPRPCGDDTFLITAVTVAGVPEIVEGEMATVNVLLPPAVAEVARVAASAAAAVMSSAKRATRNSDLCMDQCPFGSRN